MGSWSWAADGNRLARVEARRDLVLDGLECLPAYRDPPAQRRLEWLRSFSGSSEEGVAIINDGLARAGKKHPCRYHRSKMPRAAKQIGAKRLRS